MSLSAIVTRSVNLIPWGLRDRIRLIPGVAPLQRWVVAKALGDKTFVHQINAGPAAGLNFRIHMPHDKLYWTGTWEQQITSVTAAHVRKGFVCFDIGSHRGFLAGVMALAGARKTYCFEPNQANVADLEDLRALNPNLDLEIVPVAVGAKDGTAKFVLMPESTMGKLSDSPFQKDVPSVAVQEVQVRSLDSLIAAGELQAPDFIKIDIEGAEFEALTGARKILSEKSPALLIELHTLDLVLRCRAFLTELGYETRIIQEDARLDSEETYRVCHMVATKV